jgi:glycosyltransferase involved in cell wall biosynthesis
MRIVLLNQFYPPDLAPTGHYLHDVARALVASGHEVTVIASQRAYGGGGGFAADEWLDGVRVRRLAGTGFGRADLAGKLADYLGYYLQLAGTLARSTRPDLIVALTTPPYLGLLAKWTAQLRGTRHAHWVMDIYPDVMRAHGMLRDAGGRVAYRALQRLASHALGGAGVVLTLAPGMADGLRAYTNASTRVEWVPLWAPEGLEPWPSGHAVPLRAERGWSAERLVLLYSGNLGLGHRFEEFLAAAAELGPSGPRWAFAGAGRARPRIERFIAEQPALPVELLANVPGERLREHLCSADVHLMSLEPSWEGTLLPSKLQASLAVGRPILYVGDPRGDLARWIAASGAGWVVAPGASAAMHAALEAAGDPGLRAERAEAARRAGQEQFARAANIARTAELLTSA